MVEPVCNNIDFKVDSELMVFPATVVSKEDQLESGRKGVLVEQSCCVGELLVGATTERTIDSDLPEGRYLSIMQSLTIPPLASESVIIASLQQPDK